MKRRDIDMLNKPLLPSIISYTIPIILTGLLQLLFNAADLAVVGRYCGHLSVGAVSSTGAITNLIVNLFIGLSVGTGVTVSHGIGSRRDDEVHKAVHTALPTALVGGAIMTVVGVCFSGTFLQWMGTTENVLPLSTTYMQIYFGGITFSMVYNFCASILRAAGDTKSPLIFLSIAGVINVLLNLFFVTVLNMNVAGVALATTISQGISAVLVVLALMRRTDACRLELRKLRFHKAALLKIIRIGLPAGIQGSLFSISNVVVQSSVNSFGNDYIVSGNGAAANIEGFVYVAMNAFHQTAVNFIGQNLGAHKFDRVKKVFRLCMICVCVVSITICTAVLVFGKGLLSIYITDSPESIHWGLLRFGIVCTTYFLCGLMDVSTGSLRGMGASVVPMLISVLGVCGIRVGWNLTIFQIPQFHTLECLYISYPISWVVTFLAQSIAFLTIFKKRRQQDLLCQGSDTQQ